MPAELPLLVILIYNKLERACPFVSQVCVFRVGIPTLICANACAILLDFAPN